MLRFRGSLLGVPAEGFPEEKVVFVWEVLQNHENSSKIHPREGQDCQILGKIEVGESGGEKRGKIVIFLFNKMAFFWP